MMSKTHIAIGMATSLAVTRPSTIQGCILSVIGGAIGGVIADVDILDDDYKHDALFGELISFGFSAILLLTDFIFGIGIISHIQNRSKVLLIGGAAFFAILYICGFVSDHRKFTHSLVAMALFSLSVFLMCDWLAVPFLFGYLSHLLLDILNKKKYNFFFQKMAVFVWDYFMHQKQVTPFL